MRISPPSRTILRTRTARVAIGALALLVVGPFLAGAPASAAPADVAAGPVSLGSAAGFSVLGGPSIANTGAGTVLALDLGVTGTLAGFPPGTVNGVQHVGDAAASTAQEDRQTAYDSVVAQTGGTAFGGDLAGKTFTPGLYSTAAAITNTGVIKLDAGGDPSARFVFQIGAALSSAASTSVVLTNGALANNVYWQVVGAVALGANAKWVGTILGAGAVSFGDGASLKGRALTPGAVALANSPITKPIDDLTAPLVTIAGGPVRSTNDATPSISGTTDEPGTPVVTVTIGSQTLTGHASAGVWALSADTLSAGPHTVVASVTDPSGNTGTATQILTLDPSAPGVTIDGGPTRATSDVTPTISGHTDEPGTPAVTVTVGGQTLSTAADVTGVWTVEAATLGEGSYGVVASVTDAATNTGTAGQVLTVDVTVPVLTIDGGPFRTTSDTSPWIYGTTAEQAGSLVQVGLGGQSLTATVKPGGTWGVSAQALAPGTYTVLASITDAAGNTGTMTQSLQIAVGAPTQVVAIDGGPARSTNDTTPTISGSSSAPVNTAVGVTVAGQSLAATVNAGGLWTVDAATLAEGPYDVVASVTTGGSTSVATQALTVDLTAPVLSINGGPMRFTSDHTPWTYGTTTEPAGTTVHLSVDGQSLTATVRPGGAWGAGADTLADGTYTVTASIIDAAQNVGSDTQVLQVGGVFTNPAVTIDGGPSKHTNSATPTISGVSDAPPATAVSVETAGQHLAATVDDLGHWSVVAGPLSEGPHAVVASVTVDASTGTATQTLTVDVTTPALTIDGGPARSTTDDTPRLQGTTTEPSGTTVLVTVGGQSLTATVQSGGAWGVGANTLAVGTYTVLASITDAAQNTGTATQVLQITSTTPVTPPVTPPVIPPVVPPTAPVYPPSRYKPDVELRRQAGTYVGGGQYGASKQSVTQKLGRRKKTVTFEIRVTNRGDVADRMVVLGTPRSKTFKVAYFAGGRNVTKQIVAGTYSPSSLKPGGSMLLTVKIKKTRKARKGGKGAFEIRATSSHEEISRDSVTAKVRIGR